MTLGFADAACLRCGAPGARYITHACIPSATGDSGAVPDFDSVPSGDSVTLIERLTAHAELDSTRQMGSMETCSLLREAADRIAVLGEAAILRAALAECEAVLYTLRRRAEIRNWDSTAMFSRQYVDGVISKAQNALQDSEAAVLELRESERSKGLDSASALVAEELRLAAGGLEDGVSRANLPSMLYRAADLLDKCVSIETLRQVCDGYQHRVTHHLESDLPPHTENCDEGSTSGACPRCDSLGGIQVAFGFSRPLILASATRGSASLPNPDPVESDRQSSESRGLEASKARCVEAARSEAESYLALGEFAAWDGDARPRTLEHFEAEFERLLTTIGPKNTAFVMASLERGRVMANHILALCDLLASATAALPPPESDSSVLGSASALEVEALRKLAEAATPGPWAIDPVFVRDVGAIDPISSEAEWVQRIGQTSDPEDAAYIAAVSPDVLLRLLDSLASATKPEASPSPESQDLGDEQSSSCGGEQA